MKNEMRHVGTIFFIALAFMVTSCGGGGDTTVTPWAVCGDTLNYSGENYSTVQIGTQCWFAENLNIGTMVPAADGQGTDCSSIQKYCYDDTASNCTTYGGLYTWDQAMCGVQTDFAQGICPLGWHVPTDPEYVALTNFLGSANCADYRTGNTNYCGDPAEDRMKAAGLCDGRSPCGDSGFNGLMGGQSYTDPGGSPPIYRDLDAAALFWTSSKSSLSSYGEVWTSQLTVAEDLVAEKSGVSSTYWWSNPSCGRSIRCVKD